MALPPPITNGVPVPGQITTPDTFDLHTVSLTAGDSYVFIARGASEGGGTLANPNMTIGSFGPSGNFVPLVSDTGGPIGLDPIIFFTAPTTGTYGIEVGSDIPHGTGTYTLGVSLPTVPSFPAFVFHI
jgi:hypothetical protein